jgi:crotonobetainyl-CoA:carnitine CoA-transferase CaiB-like acyl-CoA transferase
MWIDPYLQYGMSYKRGETMFTGLYPWYNVYETKDGKYISIGAIETWFYKNLCQLLGCEDFIEHQYTGGEKHEEMFRYFRQTFLTKTRDEWLKILRQKDTCVAPVYSIEELVSDPQLLARGTIMEISNPTLGSVKQVSSMLKMSASPFKVRNWARSFGEHTDEILKEGGYNTSRIKSLRKAGVIG